MIEFISANSFIMAQIVGFIAVAMVIVMYQFKSHKLIMVLMSVMCGFWCLHFAMLNCWSAVVMNGVNVTRSIVYSFDDKKWARAKIVPFVFSAVAVVLVILSWQDIRSILPLIGTVFSTFANWQKDTKRLKLLTVPVCLSWGTYNFLNSSYAGFINEILCFCSIIVYFLRTYATEKKAKLIQKTAV